MYLNVCLCICMYPVCICTYMHVFVRICMYAISTENMLSLIVYMTWALGVYVFECMSMYLSVPCIYFHECACICTYLHVCHIH
jgi:hypothetical protein